MSTFSVSIVEIDEVHEHPNADRLELATVFGYRCVSQKGNWQAGDKAIYIPEDAIVPEYILEALDLTGRLAGKDKNRVKAIRLRGQISQGILAPLSILKPTCARDVGDDVAEVLGITKYEPVIPLSMSGKVRARPAWLKKYTDIENIQRHPDVLEAGEPVVITEKIHGTNAVFGLSADDPEDLFVCSRRMCLQEGDGNLYWRVARDLDLLTSLQALLTMCEAETVVLYGEIFGSGVQDLQYGCEQGELKLQCFDLRIDGEFVQYHIALNFMLRTALTPVPLVHQGPYPDLETLQKLFDGLDFSGSHVQEGIVIRPLTDRWDPTVGRVLLKAINPEYLFRKQGTERH